MNNNTIRYLHFVNSGDLISAMCSIKHIYETTGKKGVIIQRLNMPTEIYNGIHPVQDENGQTVGMNEKQWEMLVPLIESQEYIDHCEVFNGQEFDVNLNKCREGAYTTMPFGDIRKWISYTDPALQCDITKSWLNVNVNRSLIHFENDVIINFTQRYRNPLITYFFLQKWQEKIMFVGTEKEHEIFCKENNLTIRRKEVNDFLELSKFIAKSKFFLGNQSMCWNIAEAMGVPRILEVCREASNCIPLTGNGNGFDFLNQDSLEFFVERMMGETPKLAK